MSRKHKNQIQLNTPQVLLPDSLPLPVIEAPKPALPRECANCICAVGPLIKGTMKCTLNPPVYMGFLYASQTQFPSTEGFAQPRVYPTEFCSHFKER